MYIILPHTLTGVDHIVNEINSFTLARDVWAMQELPIDVWIPKFKFEFTSHLENTLREVILISIHTYTHTHTHTHTHARARASNNKSILYKKINKSALYKKLYVI